MLVCSGVLGQWSEQVAVQLIVLVAIVVVVVAAVVVVVAAAAADVVVVAVVVVVLMVDVVVVEMFASAMKVEQIVLEKRLHQMAQGEFLVH